MSYLLDTNVICELIKPNPTVSVVNWVNSTQNSTLHISVITLGEIRKGVDGIKEVNRRENVYQWLETELPAYFGDRILVIDRGVANKWGELQSTKKGCPLPVIDGLIAATAITHHLKLVTRNVKDFTNAPVDIINPWK